MAGELVLITGGTGHLGYRAIVEALKAGYRVRAAVRSLEKGQKILEAPSVKSLNSGSNIELVLVPDILAKGAYDEVIKGATYTIHIASPLATSDKAGSDPMETFVDPAVAGTLSILESASKVSSIKRIAITSSVVALAPFGALATGSTGLLTDKNRTPFEPPPYQYGIMEAYCASKVKALNDAEGWVKTNTPSFDVVYLFPSYFIGPDELVTDAKDAFRGTNANVLAPVAGKDFDPTIGASIHINDVALAHVRALDQSVPGNQGYVLSSEGQKGTNWEDAKAIVEKHFKEAVESGKLKNNGNITTIPSTVDASRATKVLGINFRSYEDQVKDTVAQYLTLI